MIPSDRNAGKYFLEIRANIEAKICIACLGTQSIHPYINKEQGECREEIRLESVIGNLGAIKKVMASHR